MTRDGLASAILVLVPLAACSAELNRRSGSDLSSPVDALVSPRADRGGAERSAQDAAGPMPDAASASTKRLQLTIDASKIDAALTDFPILVRLSSAAGAGAADVTDVFTELQNDANRTRIAFSTPGGTPLDAEIERWSTSARQAAIWVKIPAISATTDTVFYLDYGKRAADNTGHVGDVGSAPARRVWSNGFVAVYHFAESGTGTKGEYKDSTSHRIDATGGAGSASAAPGRTTGKIGYCPDFDGSNDFIEIPDHDGFSQPTTGALSIGFWFARDVLSYPGRDYIRYIGKGIAGQKGLHGANNHEWTFNIYDDDIAPFPSRRQRRSFYMCDYESGQCAGDYAQPGWQPYGPIPYYGKRTWTYYVGQADKTYVYAYNNAVLGHARVNYRTYGDNNITPHNENAPVRLGTRDTPSSSGILDGRIDEFRVSGVFRSAAWIKADYEAQRDNLIDFRPVKR